MSLLTSAPTPRSIVHRPLNSRACVFRTHPSSHWMQPDANNTGHRPKTSKTRQKRQNRSFPNIEQAFRNIEPAFPNITEPFPNIAKSFPNIPKPFPNIAEPLPNLTDPTTILRSHFAILRSHPTILRNHFPILRSHFPILQNRFTILRNHFLILRNHFPILRNGPKRLKDRFQGFRVPRYGTRTPSETSWNLSFLTRRARLLSWAFDLR